MSLPRPSLSNRGFTLIEVLLAVSIMASLTAIMWVSVGNVFETRDIVEERLERYQIMRVALDRMARELSGAFIAGPQHGGEELPGQTEAPDTEQTAAEAMQEARREPVQFGMKGRDDELNFTTFAHVRTLSGERASNQAELGYFIDRVRDRETGELVSSLMRREDTSLDDDLERGGTVYVMVPNVEEVQFEYWDAGPVKLGTAEEVAEGKWVDSWDTGRSEYAGRLPTRVRITVTLPADDPRGQEKVFVTQTQIGTTEVLEF